ncbi:M43 family zinc metalloprotease [Lewinella cohaerens]|uniref:M43 family zinc metalloprotease n=1 Tax=Lewinella cohaerens TaxID=70995 RepID=UPI00036B3D78|nr:M43 family zinc metalloprotease [Lewinella cohaerens]
MRKAVLSLLVFTTFLVLYALNDQPLPNKGTVPSSSNDLDYCGSNLAWQRLMEQQPDLLQLQESLEEAYYQDQQAASLKTAAPPYTIPVVFHIVHQGGTENIPASSIQLSLDHLNQSFANAGPYDPSTGVATNIDFCLAKRKPDGSLSSGIERVNDPLTTLNMSDDLALKNLSRYDPTQYLNIWVVDEICSSTSCGVAGYAYFPSSHGGNVDGIVVEARWLGNSPANSSVLTHEVGHYLGLYHTFEGGCQNDDCLANGDRVCDTPPDQSTAAVPCNASPNSCTTDTNDGFVTDQPDMFQNYMDYGDWGCYSMFTPGQRDRMHFFLDGIRASLQSSQGCLDPCTSPPSVSITNDFSTTVAQGATINLTADGVNADTYTWYLDGTVIGTGNPLPYIFTAEGSYNVSVQVGNSDPNCQADAQSLVLVRCPVQASFSPSSYAVTPGSVIFFTDASTNASSFEWFVDGTSEATSTGFFYQFDNLGTYTVSLEASNGDCSDEFSVVITVGTQGSSQAGLPVWPMLGGSNGGFHTVDWRTDPPTTSTVGPISDVGGGGTGAAFNSCGSVIFFAAHTAQSTPNQLFIYRPDGTPLLDASTANGPGLNAVRGPTELQVIPVPTTQDEWYLIYREYGSDSGAPANNASYSPLRLMYSRVKLEADGQLTVVVRDQVLNAGANSYTYNDGMAVSRTINGDPTQQYLYAGRHALNQSSISVDRFIISNTGISWQENTGDIPTGGYWVLTHAGSYIELSPTEDRVVVGNRNQFTNYVDFIILETANFNAASATTLMGEDLILVADGQTQDATSILPINQRIGDLGTNNSYPLLFLRNFQKKLSGVEFSPNGRFLYLTSGGYVSSGYTNLTYLAQVDLESDPLEVRLQIQDTPTPYNTTTGLGCTFSSCGEEWEAIGGVESSFDGNLYFSKRIGNQLFVIPNPNNFMPQRLVPGSIDLATAEEPNVQVIGGPGSLVDQIDGFNYLSSQSQTVNLSIFGLDCAGDCREPFDVQISSDDGSYQETFTIVACPTIIPVCADTSLSYSIVDLELGIEYPNAILNGQVNAPLGNDRFEFSEPLGCPGDCDEPYVYFYGEDADYSGRTLLAYNDFIFVGGQRGDEAMLTKLTTAGDVVWAQTMQLLNNLPNVIVDLKIDSEGMLIGAGSGRSGSNIASFTFKINPDNGATIWTRTYTDPASTYFNVSDIFESPTNGDYIILGTAFNGSSGLGCDAAFYSIDRDDGDIASERIHFHLGSCEGIESAVISNNSFFVTGRYNFSGGGFNRMRPAISSFNSTGTPLWSRLYLVGVNQDARLYSSDISLNGPNNLTILAHGDDNGIAADNNDFWIISARIINGGVEVATKYTLPEPINGKEILTINGSYVVLAQARNSNNLYLTRISSLGDVIWAKQLQNLTSTGSGDEVIQIGEYLYLTAQHTGNTNTEMALLRIDLETGEFPEGCISNEDVTVTRQSVPIPYDGFNSLSPYDTQIDGSSDFDLSPTLLDPLPISCAPPCEPEDCTNGIDDDGDGLADCEDPDCDCEEICDNGTDDDGDGLIDCDDPDLADDCCCYVPPVLELGEDIVVCENGVIVLDAGPDFTSYLWSDLTTEQTLTTTFPGEYSVAVTDQCGNTQSDTILITVDPASEIDLGPDVTLCPGETLTLTVDGFESYEWFPAGSFDCNTCPTVVFTASVDTEIIIVATNAAGCISTDTLMVTIAGTQPGSYTAAGLCPGESITFGDLTITDAGLYLDTVSTGTCLTIDSLEVTLLEPFNTTEDRMICAGQTTTIFGNEETEAGTYEMTFTAENGCDSTHTVMLNVLDTFESAETITICEGESATIFGEQQTTADEYSMTFTAENGCDSTHTITLEVLETFATSEMLSVCAGNTIEIFGNDETEAGDYSMTFTAENGCDSTHTVTLTVLETVDTEETITICDGEMETIFGEETGTAGTYSMTFMGQNDCDSTHTITLEVLDTFTTSEDISTCEGTPVDVFGTPTSEAGTYTMTFPAENGCDSTHIINLTVLTTFSTSASVGICPGESTEVFGETVNQAGEYSMTFTAENGCDSVHIITVIQLDSFSTTETIDDLCEGDSVEIFGETVTESGVYQQTFTAENGCDSLHTITVNFLPTTTTTEEVFICEGESIEIFGQQVSIPGTYQETYMGSNGCDSTHVITLTEETFSGSAYIFPPCPSDPESWIVYISTNGNGGPYTVSWNGIEVVGSTINNIPVGDHTAIVTSANGCMYTVDFTIRPYNQPWWGLVAGPSCNDPQSGEIRIQTEPTDETLTFSLDGITFSETPILDGLSEGDYTLYVKYGDRCVVTEPITVPGPETFSLALPEDQTIKWGESLPIDPLTDVDPGAIYQWTPAGSLDCPDCEKVIAQPEETTRYFLKVTDENGCTEVDDILVKVDRRIPYYVPNAFTPNNDGKNDYFTVYAATGVEEVQQMVIFDRWGGEVFVRTNFPPNREELGWDGRSRKQQVTPGVYVYYLELKLSTGEVVMVKGDVALIR